MCQWSSASCTRHSSRIWTLKCLRKPLPSIAYEPAQIPSSILIPMHLLILGRGKTGGLVGIDEFLELKYIGVQL